MCRKKVILFLGPPIILRRNPVCNWQGQGQGYPSPYYQQQQQGCYGNPCFGNNPCFANPGFQNPGFANPACYGNGCGGLTMAAISAAQGFPCHPQAQLVNLTLPRNFCMPKNRC